MEPPNDHETKKAYSAPKLVRLGSVRDLTFGLSQGNTGDGVAKKKAVK